MHPGCAGHVATGSCAQGVGVPVQGIAVTLAVQPRWSHFRKSVIPAQLVGPVAAAADAVRPHVRPGDLVLTLGAGDITIVGPQLLELLGGQA